MEYTAQQIAELLEGSLVGNPLLKVTKLSKIEEGEEGAITFLSNPKYESHLYVSKASVVIVNKSLKPTKPVAATLISVEDAYASFSFLLEIFNRKDIPEKLGIENPCFLDPSAVLGDRYYLGAFSYIGKNVKVGARVKIYPQVYVGDEVSIGDDSILYAGVKVYQGCILGKGVIIHSGAIIGSDGFGFAPKPDGSYSKIVQSGNVVIEDFVEIGSNTCIDRATIGSTYIRKGVKLDNLIQIAHNVEIGNNTVMAAQTGISGSTKIGENCVFGGQVGVAGHLRIAKGTQFGAKTGIGKNIKEEGKMYRGLPMQPYIESLKTEVLIKNLVKMEQRIVDLEEKEEKN